MFSLAVLPQVWSSDNDALHLREPFPGDLFKILLFPILSRAIIFLFTFQRLSKRSLFTGLKASNHFGRPDMSAFLRFVQKKHSYVSWQQDGEQKDKEPKTSQSLLQVSKVGVFSCGPRAVTRANSRACEQVVITIIISCILHLSKTKLGVSTAWVRNAQFKNNYVFLTIALLLWI